MAMIWTFEQNDSELWGYIGRSSESRPRPDDLSASPTSHYVVNTKLTGSINSISYDNGATWGDWKRVPTGPAYGPYSMFLMSDSDGKLSRTRDEAINKALATLNKAQFDLGVFLGELPETLRFVKQGAQDALDGYIDASQRANRADRLRARLRKRPPTQSTLKIINNLTNLIASIWLSYRYGVMPLYYALKDAMDTFNKGIHGTHTKRVKTSAKAVIDGEYHSGSTQTGSVKVRVCLTASIQSNVQSSLGMDNPALIAWELIPLSFVFDWFINVGDFLLGLTPKGMSFVSGTVSTKVDSHVFKERVVTRIEPTTVYVEGSYHGYSQSYYRETLSGLPHPRLYYKPSLSLDRYIDAFALMKTIFLKADKYSVKK